MAEETSQQGGDEQKEHFFVTKASQQNQAPTHRKFSYTGTRDLTDIEKIQELDIVAEDGTIRGMKNRVRAGQAHFDNPVVRAKKREEEGKVIVYVTSFRGVRSLNDDCRYVLTVLHNFRVKVEERDIYLNKYYYHELQERLQVEEKVPIPQVFINGQHIGGKDELEILNENGELRKVLAEIPRTKVMLMCKTCGGYKFIPCRKCGGSKNSVANNFTFEFRALKCTGCNENGLQPCPDCENKQEETEEEKEHREKLKEYERQQRLRKERAEAERLRKLEEERKAQERAKKKAEKERKAREKRERKEKARKLREKQAIMEAARQRIMADIGAEEEKEKAWKRAHGLLDEEEEETQQNELQDSSDQDSSEQSSGSSQDINNQDKQDQVIGDQDNTVTIEVNNQDKEDVNNEVSSEQDTKEQDDASHQDTVDEQQDNSEQDTETQTKDEYSQSNGDQQEEESEEPEVNASSNNAESEDEAFYNMDNEAVTNF